VSDKEKSFISFAKTSVVIRNLQLGTLILTQAFYRPLLPLSHGGGVEQGSHVLLFNTTVKLGTVFTTLNVISNLPIGPISKSVTS
jgi:hypothetical protein